MPDLSEGAVKRLKTRLSGDETIPSDEELQEIVTGLSERLMMRLRCNDLPTLAWSIVVDAGVKLVRRKFYEGISSESEGQTGSLSTSFFEQVLAEYEDDIAGLRDMLAAEDSADTSVPLVRFI